MTKLPLFFITTLACNNGKITAGDSSLASVEAESDLPSDAAQDPIEDEEPQADPDDETDRPDDEDIVDTETDTGTTTTESDDLEDDGEITLEDYLETYCGTFAVPCMGYPSVDNCVDAMLAAHFTGCTVTDKDALAECDAWVATIDCAETSWNPACDAFITCD